MITSKPRMSSKSATLKVGAVGKMKMGRFTALSNPQPLGNAKIRMLLSPVTIRLRSVRLLTKDGIAGRPTTVRYTVRYRSGTGLATRLLMDRSTRR